MTAPPWHAALTLRGRTFTPARFLAPMAGITHSAFRRLIGEFGGCGAQWTEMLAARALLVESWDRSAYVRRRPGDGPLFYQLLLSDTERLDEIVARLQARAQPDGLDLNCGCPAPDARSRRGGTELFEDPPRLQAVLRAARRLFPGLLTVKIRLGRNTPGWEARLRDALRLIADEGADAVIVHPRFTDDRLKRPAQLRLLPRLAELAAPLPLIASGDLLGPETVAAQPEAFRGVAGLMLGRIAIARPWVFANWDAPRIVPDYAAVWERLCDYIEEDFEPERALLRLKMFCAFYARSFVFGHTLFRAVQPAPSVPVLRDRARAFFATAPQRVSVPSFSGV